MGSYRVSYKLLRQQGDELKAVGKTLDGYAEQVRQIRGKLGTDEMLEPIRANLQKLEQQLGESRTVLNTAGNLLSKSVDSYSGVELRQVKKVDAMRAHNRDFYKNPVVVASAGGSSGGGAAAAKGAATTATNTYNNTYNTTNITYAEPAAGVQAVPDVQAPVTAASAEPQIHTQAAPPPVSTPPRERAVTPTPAAAQNTSGGFGAEAAAAVIGGGAAVAAGAVAGGIALKKKRDAQKASDAAAEDEVSDDYDPEAELERARQRVRELEQEN